MKILMVIDSLDKGGKERRMLELIKGLIKSSDPFEICLVSLTEKVEYKYVYQLPIRFEILKRKIKKDITIPSKLNKIISEFHPDIIHSWSTMSSIYLSVSNLFRRIPMINAVLADAPAHLNIFDKHYFRVKLTTPFSNLFISNSKAGIVSYKTPKHKSICIYNGIEFARFENLRKESEVRIDILGGTNKEAFVIAMVASFDKRKDFETLINTAIKMCSVNPSLVFLLIGDGPFLEGLRKMTPETLVAKKQIIFTGKRDDVESLLQIIDVGVLMTNPENHGEGVSNAIIEYMAMGKPVLASRGGGTDEVVKDNFNGFLIIPGSETELTKKIEILFNDRKLLQALGNNAKKFVHDNFDIEKKTVEYIDVYRKLINKRGFIYSGDYAKKNSLF